MAGGAMSQTDAWTVGRLLTWTTDYLKQHGSESPRLDAELLLAEAQGCSRIGLYTVFAEEPTEAQRTAFRALVKRRAEGMPVAYLLGRREFYSLSFRVSPDVLIPRPETEFLVVALLDLVKQRAKERGEAAAGEELAIADVGTGSGILAVCAAKYVPAAKVTAIDISPAALAVAKSNAADHGVSERIEFTQSDLFAAVDDARQFDVIVSNPPYVSESELAAASRDVRDYEPHLALVAGARGTEVIDRLVPEAAARLRPGGSLLMEISPMIEPAMREIIAGDERLEFVSTVKDLAGLSRVVKARRR
jgi:release factor glutamine methyltransferase